MNGWLFLGLVVCAFAFQALSKNRKKLPPGLRRAVEWLEGKGALPEQAVEKMPLPWVSRLAVALVALGAFGVTTYAMRWQLRLDDLWALHSEADAWRWADHSAVFGILDLLMAVVMAVLAYFGAKAGARFSLRRRGTPMQVFCCSAAGALIQVWMVAGSSGGGGGSSSSSGSKSDGYNSGGGSFGGGGATGSW